MEILDIINSVYVLPVASRLKLLGCFKEISFPKGHLLLKANKVERHIYFVKTGIVRAYLCKHEKEITFWFGREGSLVLSMGSYVRNEPSYEYVELLENSDLYCINMLDLQALYSNDIHIANWGRVLAEIELIRTEERLISREFKTATERYSELLANNSDLLQRVSLGIIASYLGITQVSLSRIRAEIS